MAVGLVVVSHSAALADAAVALARQMVREGVSIVSAGGGPDPATFGTDTNRIGQAIESADVGDGVLVLVDVGSALLSTELAVGLAPDHITARISHAPLVEGLLAGAVSSSTGADLSQVAAEAESSLTAKIVHLGGTIDPAVMPAEPAPGGDEARTMVLHNEHGLHARPAARFVSLAASFDATIVVRNVTTGSASVRADSILGISSLGAETGHVIEIRADGPEGAAATDALAALVDRGFE